jgi:hypothetical protein
MSCKTLVVCIPLAGLFERAILTAMLAARLCWLGGKPLRALAKYIMGPLCMLPLVMKLTSLLESDSEMWILSLSALVQVVCSKHS